MNSSLFHVLAIAASLLPCRAQAAPAIVFVDGGSYAIKVMNADGSNRSTLLTVGSPTNPSMSPDGQHVTFAATRNGQSGVWVVGSNGAGLRLVTPLFTTPSYVRPTWSPVPTLDGQYKLLFWDLPAASSRAHDLFVVNLDGSGRTQLTFDLAGEEYPEWSFDATRIAYTRGGMSMFVAQLGLLGGQLAITGTQNVTDLVGSPLQLATSLAFCGWANTGDTLLISAITPDSGGNFDLWSIPLTNPVQTLRLSNTTDASERWATFAADDSRIFFHGKKGIMRMNPDGSGTVTISRSGSRPNHRRR